MNRLFLNVLFLLNACCCFSQQQNAQTVQQGLQLYNKAEGNKTYSGASLPVFSESEGLKGRRYLCANWVKGTVTNIQGQVMQFDKALFNYDKIKKKLLMWLNATTMVELESAEIGSFTLQDSTASLTFERIKNTTDLNFYQPVVHADNGYSLFKLTATKLQKANYTTNGLTSSGNKFDEYIDEKQYFVLSPKKEFTRVMLKEKSVRQALSPADVKVEQFFASHPNEKVTENLLADLIRFINT